MARKPRKESILQIYHVIMRGNNRQSIYFDDNDRVFFINRMYKYSQQLKISIYSYCLMGNHVHILVGNVPKVCLSLFVQKLANSYVYYFNHKYDCSGHLFQGRFKSEPVEDEIYLKNVLRYILNNPQSAKISKGSEYKWNSYKALLETKAKHPIDSDFVINLFGSREICKRFLEIPDKNEYMEYENKPYISDQTARKVIFELLRKCSVHRIQQLSQKKLQEFLKNVKNQHLSISQISRITGLPRQVIREA